MALSAHNARPSRRTSSFVAVLGIAVLVAVLVGAVAWRLSEVSKVSSWAHLVESSTTVIADSQRVVERAQDTVEEARKEKLSGDELSETERLIVRVTALIEDYSELENYRTINKVENSESPLAVLDPYADAGGQPTSEVVIEQPDDYRVRLAEFTAVRYQLEETTDHLELADQTLADALERKQEVDQKQKTWSESRRVLADLVGSLSEQVPDLISIVPAAWHETTRNFQSTLAEATKLLAENTQPPSGVPELDGMIGEFDRLSQDLQTQFEAMRQSAAAELEMRANEAQQANTNQAQNQGDSTTPWSPSTPSTPTTPSTPSSRR